MRSQKVYSPLWMLQDQVEITSSFILSEAMNWGLWDLPAVPPEESEILSNVLHSKNIFSGVEKNRPIKKMRLVPFKKAEGISLLIVDTNVKPTLDDIQKVFVKKLSAVANRFDKNYQITPDNYQFELIIDSQVDKIIEAINDFLPENVNILLCANNQALIINKKNGMVFREVIVKKLPPNGFSAAFQTASKAQYYIIKCSGIVYPEVSQNTINRTVKTDALLQLDYLRSKAAPLGKDYLEDNSLGLWDAYWPEGVSADPKWYVEMKLDKECEAGNPEEKIQDGSVVAIDFGTSSTVAAVRENTGEVRLLRVGGQLDKIVSAEQYENPTALEFINFQEMLKAWEHEPWRPLIKWEQVTCAHEAKEELHSAKGAQRGMANIKTWARKLPGQPALRLKDESNFAFSLEPLPVDENCQNNVGDLDSRPFDPIELYAYFLGLTLNNQASFGGRIYTNYYMTFPVKFDLETRNRIRQGFLRGLMRSMPLSLVSSKNWQEKCPFELPVLESASEPTALAASILPFIGIKPTTAGVPFGVFDFGGGTADFAFGLYRKATPEEEGNEGWERVLDILDVSGDENLGGEHLLDTMAYELIQKNFITLQTQGITFLCPAGVRPFPGSETLFTPSHIAHANMVVLRERLRGLWQNAEDIDEGRGVLEIDFTTSDGEDRSVSISIDKEALIEGVKSRIHQGVTLFFTTFRQAFKKEFDTFPAEEFNGEKLHILLAGNSCRSPLVRNVFEEVKEECFPKSSMIVIHDELLPERKTLDETADDASETSDNIETGSSDDTLAEITSMAAGMRPTLKTGVALGLLQIVPGEATGVVERNKCSSEAPFLFTVGMFKDEILQPVLERNDPYNEWTPWGKVFRAGVTKFGYSNSPLAIENQIKRTECRENLVKWGSENAGKQIWIKAVGPQEIAFAIGGENAPDEATTQKFTLMQ